MTENIRTPGVDFDIEFKDDVHWIVYYATGLKQTATVNEVKLWERVQLLEARIRRMADL